MLWAKYVVNLRCFIDHKFSLLYSLEMLFRHYQKNRKNNKGIISAQNDDFKPPWVISLIKVSSPLNILTLLWLHLLCFIFALNSLLSTLEELLRIYSSSLLISIDRLLYMPIHFISLSSTHWIFMQLYFTNLLNSVFWNSQFC
jgi:hypothetical protein